MRTISFLLSFIFLSFSGSAALDEGKTSAYNSRHGKLNIIVDGLSSDAGKLMVLLFNQENGFPNEPWNAAYAIELDIATEGHSVSFESIPYGNYAIFVYHDENVNGKFDRNWAGTAREGFGYSNRKDGIRVTPLFLQSAFPFDRDGSLVEIELVPVKD